MPTDEDFSTVTTAPKCTLSELTTARPPANFGALTERVTRASVAPHVTSSAAAPAVPSPAPKSRTERFQCVDCGHSFNKRTKAGIYSRCPKCNGQAVSSSLKDRIVASSARNVARLEEGRQRRRAERQAPKRETPAPDVDGGNSAPGAEAARPVAVTPSGPPPTEPPRRRLSPTITPLEPAASSHPRPRVVPPPTEPAPASGPRRPGFFSRMVGVPGEDD